MGSGSLLGRGSSRADGARERRRTRWRRRGHDNHGHARHQKQRPPHDHRPRHHDRGTDRDQTVGTGRWRQRQGGREGDGVWRRHHQRQQRQSPHPWCRHSPPRCLPPPPPPPLHRRPPPRPPARPLHPSRLHDPRARRTWSRHYPHTRQAPPPGGTRRQPPGARTTWTRRCQARQRGPRQAQRRPGTSSPAGPCAGACGWWVAREVRPGAGRWAAGAAGRQRPPAVRAGRTRGTGSGRARWWRRAGRWPAQWTGAESRSELEGEGGQGGRERWGGGYTKKCVRVCVCVCGHACMRAFESICARCTGCVCALGLLSLSRLMSTFPCTTHRTNGLRVNGERNANLHGLKRRQTQHRGVDLGAGRDMVQGATTHGLVPGTRTGTGASNSRAHEATCTTAARTVPA
jgi:hypothetical protein